MTSALPPGLYDLLQTPQLKKQLEASGLMESAVWANVDAAELPDKIAAHLAKEIGSYLSETVFAKKDEVTREYYSGLIGEFVGSSVEAVLGKLADNNQFSLELTQRNAWNEEIVLLQSVLAGFTGKIILSIRSPAWGNALMCCC